METHYNISGTLSCLPPRSDEWFTLGGTVESIGRSPRRALKEFLAREYPDQKWILDRLSSRMTDKGKECTFSERRHPENTVTVSPYRVIKEY